MKKFTRIIVNADDFGQSSAVNEAVMAACENGVLTSATIMANMPGFEEAARGAASMQKLGVGVHLNILRGVPLSEPSRIRSLVCRRGCFLDSAGAFLARALSGRIDYDDVEAEFAAQIGRVIDFGITPTHLDSEKHLHIAFPRIGRIACALAKRFGIGAVRIVREPVSLLRGMPKASLSQTFKLMILNRQGSALTRVASGLGLAFADRSFGVALAGRMDADIYRRLFRAVSEGSMEIMCHPATSGNASAGARSVGWLDRFRAEEYRALVDPAVKEALAASGSVLINYGDLYYG
ncbi:MAG TPA: ChbG/HpnK family deacetylase [bacterium]|nr:ChbG/HpnK family deacetylase [bacterium]